MPRASGRRSASTASASASESGPCEQATTSESPATTPCERNAARTAWRRRPTAGECERAVTLLESREDRDSITREGWMDKGERLTQFLEWVEARRASSLNAVDLRGIGVALLDESGGGRVTE